MAYSSTLKKEAVRFSEASINFYQITRRRIQEDSTIKNKIFTRCGSEYTFANYSYKTNIRQ
jgi:hypothetical protein